MKDRLEEQYAWRKEQLEREVAALITRKGSIVAQLSNLRQLAGDAPLDYPDDDPLGTSDPRDDDNASWRKNLSVDAPAVDPTLAAAAQAGATAATAPEKTQVVEGSATAKLSDAESETHVIQLPDAEQTTVIKLEDRN